MCVRVCVNKSNNICLKKQEYTMEKKENTERYSNIKNKHNFIST